MSRDLRHKYFKFGPQFLLHRAPRIHVERCHNLLLFYYTQTGATANPESHTMSAAATLGKRAREEEILAWRPDMEMKKDASLELMRTQRLFLELQNTVHSALLWRHARDAKARQESAAIAERHPIAFPDPDETPATSHDTEELVLTVAKKPKVLSFEEKMKADAAAAKANMEAKRSLPSPLTQLLLNDAYKQLPRGAEQSIESVIQCWRTNKLDASDVIATVKSFSGRSAVLQAIFSSDTPQGEVASEEQMRELASLAASSC